MADHDQEMLNELIIESREHLSGIEPDLLELEKNGQSVSDDLINRVFRAVHSIKGGFGFFGLDHITALSHSMENVMSRVRDKLIRIEPGIVDALFAGIDKLRVMLDDAANSDSIEIKAEVEALAPFLGEKPKKAVPVQVQAPAKMPEKIEAAIERDALAAHPSITQEKVIEAIRNGKLLYELALTLGSDILDKGKKPAAFFDAWEKISIILDVIPPLEELAQALPSTQILVVLATVLEADLIEQGLGLSAEKIISIDTSELKRQLLHSEKTKDKEPHVDAAVKVAATKQSETKIEDVLRVRVKLLDDLMNLAGELVLSRNQLIQSVNRKLSEALESDRMFKDLDRTIAQSFVAVTDVARRDSQGMAASIASETARIREAYKQALGFRLVDVPGVSAIMQDIDMVTSMLQEDIMQTRLQPISVVFSKFPRVIRDLAKKLDKEINLTIVGQEVELDKSIVELLSDPLTHLIRNSVDHGIESQAKRKAAGKKVVGQVTLRAYHEGGKVHIEILDDGAGINAERVREKAIEKGLVTAEACARMSETEIQQFIVQPGFSTAEVVSDVSGRGVGMDVVKTNIERLGGSLEIESTFGKGTRIIMKLPLTLAIISSLIISVKGRRFAIPQVGIEELVRIRASDITARIERVATAEVLRLRGKLLPLVRLEDVLGMNPTFVDPVTGERKPDKRSRWSDRRGVARKKELDDDQPKSTANVGTKTDERRQGPDRRVAIANAVKVVVLRIGEQRYGLIVEEVHDSEEIVVKPLSIYMKTCSCYAGATIMGDGMVSMILDTNGISRLAGLKYNELEKEIEAEKEKFAKQAAKQIHEMLLFTNGGAEHFALSLASIARVEKVPLETIQRVGSKEYINHGDESMRLVRLEEYLPVSGATSSDAEAYVIIPKNQAHPLGIVAGNVDDVVQTELVIDTSNIKGVGMSGSAVINKQLTILVDIDSLFKAAEPEMF